MQNTQQGKKKPIMGYLHKLFISLTLVLSAIILNAQNDNSIENSSVKKESYLTFDAFSSLNTYSPRWRFGYVKGISPKWKLGLNLGYGNSNISYTGFAENYEEDYELWEIKPELYYNLRQTQKSTTYGSFELYYINHQDIYHDYYYLPIGGGVIRYDQADYLRQKYGFNFNIGTFIHMGKWFGMNIFTGVGFKIRNNSFSNIVNPEPADPDFIEMLSHIDMYDDNEYKVAEGLDYGFNFSLGLKLLFR